MFCTKCGEQNQEDAVFCTKCGQQMSKGEPTAIKSPAREGIGKGRHLKLILVVLCVVAAVGWLGIRHYHRSSPDYALAVIDNVHTPADVEHYSAYFTPKGREVELWLVTKGNEKPSTSDKTTYSKPVVNGDTCNVSGTNTSSEGKSVFNMQFKKSDRWQLDDIYIETLCNHEINLWASSMKDILDVLEAVQKVNSPADIEHYSSFFSSKGRNVILWLLSKNDNTPSTASKTSFSEPLLNGDTCTLNYTTESKDGTFTYAIQLKKTDRWQYDDMYVDSVNGKKIGLWCSYMHDHPVLTFFKINWHDLSNACIKGFIIGATAAGG